MLMPLFLAVVIILGIAACFVFGFILLRIFLGLLADRDILFTFCAEGEIKYLMKGDTLWRVIMRVFGKKIDSQFDIVDDPTPEKHWLNPLWYLEHYYGIFWIGFPPFGLHVYNFEWDKLVNEGDDRYEISHRKELVDSLFFRYTYPVVARGVDLGGNLMIDIFATIVVEAVNVYRPVHILKGNWFIPLRGAVEGAMNDYPKGQGIKKFREEEKQAPNSDFAKRVLRVNRRKGGVIDMTGMKIVSFNYGKYDITPNQPEIQAALLAKQREELLAQGVVAKSKGDATSIRNIGKAEADAAEAQLAVADRHRLGAELLQNRNLSRAISEHEGALVFGQGSGIMIGTDSGGRTPPPSPSSPPRTPTGSPPGTHGSGSGRAPAPTPSPTPGPVPSPAPTPTPPPAGASAALPTGTVI